MKKKSLINKKLHKRILGWASLFFGAFSIMNAIEIFQNKTFEITATTWVFGIIALIVILYSGYFSYKHQKGYHKKNAIFLLTIVILGTIFDIVNYFYLDFFNYILYTIVGFILGASLIINAKPYLRNIKYKPKKMRKGAYWLLLVAFVAFVAMLIIMMVDFSKTGGNPETYEGPKGGAIKFFADMITTIFGFTFVFGIGLIIGSFLYPMMANR